MDHQQNVVASSTFAGLGAATVALGFIAPRIERTIPIKAIGFEFLVISGIIGLLDVQKYPRTSDLALYNWELATLGLTTTAVQAYAVSALALSQNRTQLGWGAAIVGTVIMIPSVVSLAGLTKRIGEMGYKE